MNSAVGVHELGPVHTELLAIAMQKWVENVAKELVEYPFLEMSANGNAQCERTLTLKL